ncbi:cation-translocating P-type ATPase [Cellvibrio sp. PSBB023]|uniref:cation-translocating P-type ATPase n=1 Tax=Cellvibrio sp. PSBB023 TaxID=1945512 RepID=UPI0009901887|nr:cation-translocating P-type ATPase [Cellvibrio sp. PSBB023]AQT61122.1 ATPase [Cellvibrio sp. PSBB023]
MTPDDRNGLSHEEAAKRLKAEGPNQLPKPNQRHLLRILLDVLREPMFSLLIGGGVIYWLLGDTTEALLLLVFASISVSITLIQESRSERVLESLRDLASPRAQVIRSGERLTIAGTEVVRGDLIVVNEGDRVAADSHLLSAHDLLVDESLLTGESVAVTKTAPDETTHTKDNSDQQRMYAGTLVVRGTGIAQVSAIGLDTEMGHIGHALSSIDTEQAHLQQQLRWLVRDFAILGAIAALLVVVLYGLLRGSWLEAILGGIAIGMSLLPEEFPLVMAVFMAMGAWRISQARVLTRRAAAIETLGATTVLCTDKTGTLTQNRMTLMALVSGNQPWLVNDQQPLGDADSQLLEAALLACHAMPSDPMDLAVQRLAQHHARLDRFQQAQRLRAYGLRPELFATTNILHCKGEPEPRAYTKGALEAIAQLCHLPPPRLAELTTQANQLAQQGMRVLAVAQAPVPTGELPESPTVLHFDYLGLLAFADPLRDTVPAAVAECQSAGIRVVMITGDYPTTASAIARQAGLPPSDVLVGDELEQLSDIQLAERVKTTSIFARIRPQQKLRLVQCLKSNGDIVAMTGDGVNDAPAIKAAHIGIAMGGRGTDVAREASSIVLLDDDFGSIVKTIRLGRRIYDNLRKAIEFIVAVHIPIAGLAILPLLMGLPLILTPIHIAFLEMVIDPACSVVFEAEQEEEDVMTRPPRDPQTPLLVGERIGWAVTQGLVALALLAGLLIGGAYLDMPENDLRALVFGALVLFNMGLILINRSFRASLASAFLRPNRSLWILLSAVSITLAIAVSWPPAQQLFSFGSFHLNEVMICASLALVSLLLLEGIKVMWFKKRKTA